MLSRHHSISLVCVTVGILAAVGCKRERERTETVPAERAPTTREQPGTTTVTGATMANTAAVDRIVAARCERESMCKNIGPDKKHVSPQACTQKLHADMKDDLNPKECPAGIDQKELNECLEAIHKEDCNNPLDSIARLAACRTSDLCLKTAAPVR